MNRIDPDLHADPVGRGGLAARRRRERRPHERVVAAALADEHVDELPVGLGAGAGAGGVARLVEDPRDARVGRGEEEDEDAHHSRAPAPPPFEMPIQLSSEKKHARDFGFRCRRWCRSGSGPACWSSSVDGRAAPRPPRRAPEMAALRTFEDVLDVVHSEISIQIGFCEMMRLAQTSKSLMSSVCSRAVEINFAPSLDRDESPMYPYVCPIPLERVVPLVRQCAGLRRVRLLQFRFDNDYVDMNPSVELNGSQEWISRTRDSDEEEYLGEYEEYVPGKRVFLPVTSEAAVAAFRRSLPHFGDHKKLRKILDSYELKY